MRLLPLYALTTCALAAPRGRGGTPTKPSTSERQRRLYDRGCLFSPEGRVYQVEYAEKNVARGSFAVGAVAPDGVALAAVRSAHARSVPGAFLERRWRERVHRVDDTIACVACGLVPDALQLLAALRDFCRRHRSTWGEAPPVEACARHLGRLARAATARAAGRPYGAAFLIGGFDEGLERAAALQDGTERRLRGLRRGRRRDGGRRARRVDHRGPGARRRGFWRRRRRRRRGLRGGRRGRGGVAADGPERRRRDGRRARRAAALGLRDLRRGRARRALEQRVQVQQQRVAV